MNVYELLARCVEVFKYRRQRQSCIKSALNVPLDIQSCDKPTLLDISIYIITYIIIYMYRIE